jgi:hypothetical protein
VVWHTTGGRFSRNWYVIILMISYEGQEQRAQFHYLVATNHLTCTSCELRNILKHIGYCTHQEVEHSEILRSSPQSVFICFVCISQQAATIFLYSIN